MVCRTSKKEKKKSYFENFDSFLADFHSSGVEDLNTSEILEKNQIFNQRENEIDKGLAWSPRPGQGSSLAQSTNKHNPNLPGPNFTKSHEIYLFGGKEA